MALECSCLAAGAIRHPGGFHGSALVNPARDSSAHRPQQLRLCLFHIDMGSLPPFSLLQTFQCNPARSLRHRLHQHLKAGPHVEVPQWLFLLPSVSTKSIGISGWVYSDITLKFDLWCVVYPEHEVLHIPSIKILNSEGSLVKLFILWYQPSLGTGNNCPCPNWLWEQESQANFPRIQSSSQIRQRGKAKQHSGRTEQVLPGTLVPD